MKEVISCCGVNKESANSEKEDFSDRFVVPNGNFGTSPSTEPLIEAQPLTWKFWQKRRYIVVLMAFFGFFNVYTLRVNLSVGIVAMTENRTIYYSNGTVGYVS